MLEDNPCRRDLFEVFHIDKSATDLRSIHAWVKDKKEIWAHENHTVKGWDGEVFAVDEARMNALEARLFVPNERLIDEQFAHQPHPFAEDPELAAAIIELQAPRERAVLAGDARAIVGGVLGPLLPKVSAPPMPDDLPEPARPAPFPIEKETLEQAILRDF
jgi:hypothetical protein